jgi:hypothetical protein
MIAERLASIPGLAGRFKMLSQDEADAQYRDLRRLLADQDSRGHDNVRHLDASDSDPSEISHWLSTQGLGNEPVRVHWLNDHQVAVMSMNDLIENLGELWHPSADDLVVLPFSNRYMLCIDHEEQVFLGRDCALSVDRGPGSDTRAQIG